MSSKKQHALVLQTRAGRNINDNILLSFSCNTSIRDRKCITEVF